MIRTNFRVSNEEKNRILNLHESATKKLYLKEQEENEGVRFSMPLPTNIVPGSTISFDMIYNEGVLSYIAIDGMMFNIPEKTEIEKSGVDGSFVWVEEINDMIKENVAIQNENLFYIPSFDKNNLRLVWIICTFDRKTKRYRMIKNGVREIGKSIPRQD